MPKKVYFCGSIRGGRSDYRIYQELIRHITTYATVLTEHVGDVDITADHGLSDEEIHDRDMNWLKESDLIIAEVTQNSIGVGYEIGRAVELGKPVVCLFRPKDGQRLSAMISGSANLRAFNYSNLDEAKEILDAVLSDDS